MDDTAVEKVRIVADDTPEIVAALDRIAQLAGLSRAAYIRMLIRAALREAAERAALIHVQTN